MMCLKAASVKEKQLVVTAPMSEDFSEEKRRKKTPFRFFNILTLSGVTSDKLTVGARTTNQRVVMEE